MDKTKVSLPRTRNHGLPLIKPFVKTNKNNVKRWNFKQTTPIEVHEHHLKRSLDWIKDVSKPKVGSAKQGTAGEAVFAICVHPSIELLNFSHTPIPSYNVNSLLHQLRKSLLSHDWKSCSRLLEILIFSKSVNRRLLIYIFRCVLIVCMNHRIPSEVLKDYLMFTLGKNGKKEMNRLIRSIFTFPQHVSTKRVKVQ